MSDTELQEALAFASQQPSLWDDWARQKMRSLLQWFESGKTFTKRQRAFALSLISKDYHGLSQNR